VETNGCSKEIIATRAVVVVSLAETEMETEATETETGAAWDRAQPILLSMASR